VKNEAEDSPPLVPAKPHWTSISASTLILLAVTATVLRFLFLAAKPFWFDECFSVEVARLRWHDFAWLLWRREANMSLYYLMLRGWLHFASSPFFIRSLSVIISLATLPAIFWLASELYDRKVALFAVALMTFNAYSIRYAQEARSYSLFVLLATLSSGFFISVVRKRSRRNWWGYVLAGVLAIYAHLYALLLLAAHWLSLRRSKIACPHSLRRAWICVGIASLPILIFAAKTGAGPIRWIRRPGLHDALEFADHLTGNAGWPLVLLYVGACIVAIFAPDNAAPASEEESTWPSWRVRFLTLWLLFPVGATLLLSLARPLFVSRYFIFCLPALLILAAAGLARLRKSWLSALTLAAMLLFSLQGTLSYYDHDFDLQRDDSQGATNYILSHAQAGDVILFHIAEARVPYEFFTSVRFANQPAGRAQPKIIYPRHGDRLDYQDFTGKPATALIESLSSRYSRVWLVLMSNGTPGHPDATTLMLNQILGQSFPQVESTEFTGVEVRLYRMR
jgi:uncharacterized membrane protein